MDKTISGVPGNLLLLFSIAGIIILINTTMKTKYEARAVRARATRAVRQRKGNGGGAGSEGEGGAPLLGLQSLARRIKSRGVVLCLCMYVMRF
jgi:hypothetical protein